MAHRAIVIVAASFILAFVPEAAYATEAVSLQARRPGLAFEENTGRYGSRVGFVARTRRATFFLSGGDLTMVLTGGRKPVETAMPFAARRSRLTSTPSCAVRVRLVGANPECRAVGLGLQRNIVNYIVNRDPRVRVTGVRTFARAKFIGVYPGVDVVYYGAGGGPGASRASTSCLEYDFTVAPRADSRRIRLAFDGVRRVSVAGGHLILATPAGDVRLNRPEAYQMVGERRVPVACRYRLASATGGSPWAASIRLGRYDTGRPLVIDPVLAYATFVGGGDADEGYALAVDSAGCAYITGATRSPDFPTTPGAYDATHDIAEDVFVSKFSADGSGLLYSTFIGGSDSDIGYGIAVDAAGCAHVVGYTGSSDFPTTASAYDRAMGGGADTFALKLSADGSSLVYSTFLGGSGSGESARAVAVSASGDAYVTGWTGSADFPTTPGAWDTSYDGLEDVFVTRLNSSGSGLVYSTFVGGAGGDYAYGIALHTSGSVRVAGHTTSSDFPVTSGAFDTAYNGGFCDAFALSLDASGGALQWATFIGGAGHDYAYGIALDTGGAVHVAGATNSSDLPTTDGALDRSLGGEWDAWAARLLADGSGMAYGTFLGGSGLDGANCVSVDASGRALLTGWTDSGDFPTTTGALDATYNGSGDAFLSRLDAGGTALTYSTFLGGFSSDIGHAVAPASTGAVICTGYTASSNFPATPGSYDTSHNGGDDCYVIALAPGAGTITSAPDRTGTITEVVTLRAYLRRASDSAWLQGRTIGFAVDGSSVGGATTNADGRADLNWTIPDGPPSRTILAEFAGDAEYEPSSDTATLTCQSWTTKMATFDRTARITDRTELKCRLLRSDNVPLYGKSINFYVDGTFVIIRPTDVQGYAKYPYYTVPDGAGAGARTILSEWPGNGGYAAISKAATLTVNRAIAYMWVHRKTVPYGGIANLYAYFRRLYDYQKQAGKTVTFRLDGTWIADVVTGTGAEAGVARHLYYTTEPPGVYVIRCEFAGDAWVDAGFGEANLTIF